MLTPAPAEFRAVRAGVVVYLVPVFASILAVVLGGIWLSERGKARG